MAPSLKNLPAKFRSAREVTRMQMAFEFIPEKRNDILRFLAQGNSLEEVFTNAGRALFEIIAKPDKILPKTTRFLELKADSSQLLLFDFLDELLKMVRVQGFLANDVRVQRITEQNGTWLLKVRLRGDLTSNHVVTNVRAIAYEDTHLEEAGDRYSVQVTVKL